MKNRLALVLLLLTLGFVAGSALEGVNHQVQAKAKPEMIVPIDPNQYGGAHAYANAGDNPNSRYYVNLDFYNMPSDDQLTIIPKFKTMQQTTEWSSANAAVLMVLYHFGNTDFTEMQLAEIMISSTDLDTPGAKPGSADNYYEYGTDIEQIYRFFSNLEGFAVLETSYRQDYGPSDLVNEDDGFPPSDVGNLRPTFSLNSLYTAENDDASENWVDAAESFFVTWLTGHLKANRPIIVAWGDWDGHWQVIIGYDTNGTPGIGDDILIFADPYDTSDHWQDGYYYYPLERWFFMWMDRDFTPKPYQLQPFIVVDAVN
ncbi:MAG: papain-like cysteine protease family protein [Bacillota bacterium]|jgi:hypothetical protein|nr:papain-like cysteine protease family protein [Bacillota bacterium]MDI9442189.1 papain-like cysteine protease family protein [Bacillota bacterium]